MGVVKKRAGGVKFPQESIAMAPGMWTSNGKERYVE